MSAINDAPTPDPKPRHPNWGGKRPGAGAPKGNFNAFRHGRYSKRQQELVDIIAATPELADPFAKIARRKRVKSKQAREGASELLAQAFARIGEYLVIESLPADERDVSSPADKRLELNRDLARRLFLLQALIREIPKN